MQADMIIVQWNTLTDPLRTFEKIRSQNIKIGLGLTPDDVLDNVSHFFREIDLLLLLGVYPGFGGQSIQPGTSEKIKSARKIIDQTDNRPLIAADGGVKLENAADLVQAGADMLIMGTALFQSTNMAETVKSVRESIVGSQRHWTVRIDRLPPPECISPSHVRVDEVTPGNKQVTSPLVERVFRVRSESALKLTETAPWSVSSRTASPCWIKPPNAIFPIIVEAAISPLIFCKVRRP
jgi:hypothetical protein